MNRFLKLILAASAMSAAATAANASPITWNFGTSGYSLVGPAGGPNAATASGSSAPITANGQGAVFKDLSNLFGVTAYAYTTSGSSPQPHIAGSPEKVTQSNNSSAHLTGLGACNASCSGSLASIGNTEMLGLYLGSHSPWTLGSITLENFTLSPSANQAVLWFSNFADGSSPLDATTLNKTTSCASTGADGSCTFNFSSIPDANINSYSYLFVTAFNYPDNQPNIVVTQLTGNTANVPEPATLALFGAGLAAAAAMRRRKKANKG